MAPQPVPFFSFTHKSATEILFQEILDRGFRAIAGKCSMDRHAPDTILQNPESDAIDNESLIEKWHGREGRIHYALTPRVSPACSDGMLKSIAGLKRKYPDVYLQTHYSEQPEEIEWAHQLFPDDADHLAVYERFELTGSRVILAHSVHLDPSALDRLRNSRTIVAHCPTSNLFLGSGLFPMQDIDDHHIPMVIGSDIGGGTSFSMWRTLDSTYNIQQLRGNSVHPVRLLDLATLNAARSLGLDSQIGNFSAGRNADFQVFDINRHRLLKEKFSLTSDPIERLFVMIMQADDRIVNSVYIRGRLVYSS
jgi:guanine deaminase